MADHNFRSDRGEDPIAELARLIGQAVPHGESAPADRGWREGTASEGYEEPTRLPPAPQLPGRLNAPEQAHELDQHRHDEKVCDAGDQPWAADEEYQNEAPHRRRRSSLPLVMAIFGLAVVGAVGAFDYRDVFVGSVLPMLPSIIKASNEPNKIAPASREPQAKNSDTASQADTAVTGSIENLVSRENKPVITRPPKPPTPPAVGHSMANQPMPRRAAAAADPPWPPHATTDPSKGAGQSGAVDVTVVTPPVLGGGYAVQVSSERSESRAQAAFRALQAQYPNQLGGRRPIIRRADLGAGTYYRTLVGPFASADKAARFCSGLKAAGGNCIIQKN